MRISIVICTAGRPHRLSKAINSCLNQTSQPNELIIIDDGNLPENTVARFREENQKKGIVFHYIKKDSHQKGLTISRNIGWNLASGQIIQYLDDDAELDARCIEYVRKIFSDTCPTLSGVDFPIQEEQRKYFGRRLIEWCYASAGLWKGGRRLRQKFYLPMVLGEDDFLIPVDYLQGGSMAIPKKFLERIGGFDESLRGYALGEDKDISIRLSRVGPLGRVKDVFVRHFSDPLSRPDPKTLGAETAFNYLYINSKGVRLGMGETLLLLFNIAALLKTELFFAMIGDRKRHTEQFFGMTKGIFRFLSLMWKQ